MADGRIPALLGSLARSVDELLETDAAVLAEGETLLAFLGQLSRLELVASRASVAFEASPEWRDEGAQNGACWITSKRGCARHVPRRRLKLGKAIADMPVVAEAWAAGEIDPEHVEVLAEVRTKSVAEAFERDEHELVATARGDMFHRFAANVTYWRQHVAPDEAEPRAESQREQRKVHLSRSFQGMWFGSITLDPIRGEIVNTALERLERELFDAEWADLKQRLGRDPRGSDVLRTPAQRRADALVEMAKRAATAPANGRPPAPLFSVVIDYPTFAGRICELASQTPVTPGSLVPWLDEAYMERVVFDGNGALTDVGPRRRLFAGRLRRGIRVRDRECGHPLCDQPVERCEVDHVEPYAAGGDTTADNGRLLCEYHNRLRTRRRRPNSPQPGIDGKTDPVFPNDVGEDDGNEGNDGNEAHGDEGEAA